MEGRDLALQIRRPDAKLMRYSFPQLFRGGPVVGENKDFLWLRQPPVQHIGKLPTIVADLPARDQEITACDRIQDSRRWWSDNDRPSRSSSYGAMQLCN